MNKLYLILLKILVTFAGDNSDTNELEEGTAHFSSAFIHGHFGGFSEIEMVLDAAVGEAVSDAVSNASFQFNDAVATEFSAQFRDAVPAPVDALDFFVESNFSIEDVRAVEKKCVVLVFRAKTVMKSHGITALVEKTRARITCHNVVQADGFLAQLGDVAADSLGERFAVGGAAAGKSEVHETAGGWARLEDHAFLWVHEMLGFQAVVHEGLVEYRAYYIPSSGKDRPSMLSLFLVHCILLVVAVPVGQLIIIILQHLVLFFFLRESYQVMHIHKI